MDNYPIVGCRLFAGYGEGTAVVVSGNRKNREFRRQEFQQGYRRVVEIGGSSKLPLGFDHMQVVADVIHYYHQREEDVEAIIILADLLTPRGWDMVKLLFPERDLASDNQGNILITEDKPSCPLWGRHIVGLRQQLTTTAPTASA